MKKEKLHYNDALNYEILRSRLTYPKFRWKWLNKRIGIYLNRRTERRYKRYLFGMDALERNRLEKEAQKKEDFEMEARRLEIITRVIHANRLN